MRKPINFAVIGCGMLARSQHIPNIAKSKKAVLHTCCDLSDEALKKCKEKFGADLPLFFVPTHVRGFTTSTVVYKGAQNV